MKVEQRPAGSPSKEALTDKATLLTLYREMLLIRRFEEKTAEMYQAAKIGGFCHLNIGEEATIVGSISALRPTDYVYSTYREHGHALAKGLDPKAVMAELFGKETGTSHGRGGSMHLFSHDHRFYGGYAIVAQAREKHEPSLLECVTYRYRGHSMSDPDTYRGKDEIKEWQTRDAILSLAGHLKKQKMLTDEDVQRIDEEVTAQVEDAVTFAEESPDPDPKDLYRDVYAGEAS